MPPIEALRTWLSIFLFFLIVTTGCSTLSKVQTPKIKPLRTEALSSGNGWWFARYRMNWPQNTEPCWHMDLYLAHQVIWPLLKVHQSDIPLWRFHRRAARDGAGHQFSFIFYGAPQTARNIFQSLQSNSLVDSMKFAGVIADVVYDDPLKLNRPNIEDTSDKNWPSSIQKAWPYYIMGASQMWLNLIGQIADDDIRNDSPSSVKEVESFYKQVDDTITNLWQKQGRHAFLHHLNALFEYKPLIYYEKRNIAF